MASNGSLKMGTYAREDESDDDGYHQNQQKNLSRPSFCASSVYKNDDDGDDVILVSGLSLESFDGADADGEVSNVEKEGDNQLMELISSDSDKEPGCYSLPATPSCGKTRVLLGGTMVNNLSCGGKDYSVENEGWEGRKGGLRGQGRAIRESDHGGGGDGGGVVVITKPKGGERRLCMDLEEVKACRDLGFELEHERMLEVVPGSASAWSGLETSRGGNSPMANWRISGPGDDPRDVKARLKVWAQAVALASASRHAP